MDRRQFIGTATNVAAMPDAMLKQLLGAINTGTLEAKKKALFDLLIYRHKLAHSDPYDPEAKQPLDTLASLDQAGEEIFKIAKKNWLEPIGNKPELLDIFEAKEFAKNLADTAKELREAMDAIRAKLEAVDEVLSASKEHLPPVLSYARYEAPVVFNEDMLSDIRSISEGSRTFYSNTAYENVEERAEQFRTLSSAVTNAQIKQPKDWKEQREKNLLKHLREQLKRLDPQYFSIELGPERGPGSADIYVIACKGPYVEGENGKEPPPPVMESIRSVSVDLKLLADLHEGTQFSYSASQHHPLLFEQKMAISSPSFAVRKLLFDTHSELLKKGKYLDERKQAMAGSR